MHNLTLSDVGVLVQWISSISPIHMPTSKYKKKPASAKSLRVARKPYRTCICSLGTLGDQCNRFAVNGWIPSKLLAIGTDRVLVLFNNGLSPESEAEVSMIELQSLIAQRSLLVAMTSKLLKALEDSTKSIIDNIK